MLIYELRYCYSPLRRSSAWLPSLSVICVGTINVVCKGIVWVVAGKHLSLSTNAVIVGIEFIDDWLLVVILTYHWILSIHSWELLFIILLGVLAILLWPIFIHITNSKDLVFHALNINFLLFFELKECFHS